jgi:hypothetical protein
VDEEQLAAATVNSDGTLRKPAMVACSSVGAAPLAATPAGDVLCTATMARCGSVLEQRRLGEALLGREEGEAMMAFFPSREESERGKE